MNKKPAKKKVPATESRVPLITLFCSSCPVYESFHFPRVRVVSLENDVVETSLHYLGGWEIDYQDKEHPINPTQKLIATCPACLKQ